MSITHRGLTGAAFAASPSPPCPPKTTATVLEQMLFWGHATKGCDEPAAGAAEIAYTATEVTSAVARTKMTACVKGCA